MKQLWEGLFTKNPVLANDPSSAPAHLRLAFKALDQAAAKGIIHKNTASRKKSRLSKRLTKLA
jgi:small subunit ribosomal protein S20